MRLYAVLLAVFTSSAAAVTKILDAAIEKNDYGSFISILAGCRAIRIYPVKHENRGPWQHAIFCGAVSKGHVLASVSRGGMCDGVVQKISIGAEDATARQIYLRLESHCSEDVSRTASTMAVRATTASITTVGTTSASLTTVGTTTVSSTTVGTTTVSSTTVGTTTASSTTVGTTTASPTTVGTTTASPTTVGTTTVSSTTVGTTTVSSTTVGTTTASPITVGTTTAFSTTVGTTTAFPTTVSETTARATAAATVTARFVTVVTSTRTAHILPAAERKKHEATSARSTISSSKTSEAEKIIFPPRTRMSTAHFRTSTNSGADAKPLFELHGLHRGVHIEPRNPAMPHTRERKTAALNWLKKIAPVATWMIWSFVILSLLTVFVILAIIYIRERKRKQAKAALHERPLPSRSSSHQPSEPQAIRMLPLSRRHYLPQFRRHLSETKSSSAHLENSDGQVPHEVSNQQELKAKTVKVFLKREHESETLSRKKSRREQRDISASSSNTSGQYSTSSKSSGDVASQRRASISSRASIRQAK